MKKVISALLVLALMVTLLAGCTPTNMGGNYEYKGFIIDVYENAKGETAIVTISGDVESHFVFKENTRMTAPAQIPVAVGDCIMLNTARRSDEYIKECRVTPAYSCEGRLVYVEGDDAPFLLTRSADGGSLLVRLIDDNGTLAPGTSGIGDVIKVFHQLPIALNEPTVQLEGLIYIANGSISDLTDEDIAFIESSGYLINTK